MTPKPAKRDSAIELRPAIDTAADRGGRGVSAERECALYVDLDGTLVATDLLSESICALLRSRPLVAWRLALWLLQGRAAFKQRVAERVQIDPATLPYQRAVLDFLAAARPARSRIVLATASDARLARVIAEHLQLFDAVIASDGRRNLSGTAKLAAIEEDAGTGGFEYVGNARVDLPIWARASRAWLVAPSQATLGAVERLATPSEVLVAAGSARDRARTLARSLRPHQWVKNVLLFVPLILAHQLQTQRFLATFVAFGTFCASASASYLLNDLVDLQADRLHPRKRGRAMAAGALSIPSGLALGSASMAVAFAISLLALPAASTAMLAIYVLLTTLYSCFLKKMLLVDVLALAGLYTHRILAGGVAAEVPVSPWLLAFSLFIFLSLAFVKRYVELAATEDRAEARLASRGYETRDLGVVATMGVSSGLLAVLVIGLYVSSENVRRLYEAPELLWFTCPVLLYWIGRFWFLANRGVLPDDPVLFAATDCASYAVFGLIAAIGVLAAVGFGPFR